MKIYLIAGEASGDILGAKLIKALCHESKEKIEFFGIGGVEMEKEGIKSLFDISELSLMGFSEILPHIPNLIRRINQTVADINQIKPDIVITIDSPGFCFRVAKKLGNREFKLIHYVAPTVWAYKEKRANKMAKLYDHLLLLLPFEKPYFDKVGLSSTFVGHPIVEDKFEISNFRERYKIKENTPILSMLPGSRKTELKRLLPIFTEALRILKNRIGNFCVVIAALPNTKNYIRNFKLPVKTIILDKKYDKQQAYRASDFALAKSGTGALEITLAKVPLIICYKVSQLSSWLVGMLIKIKYANLVNIMENREIIPELIQEKCRPELIADELEKILKDKNARDKQIKAADDFYKKLGGGKKVTPSVKAARAVLNVFERKKT